MKIGLIGAGRLGICLALLIERAGFDVIASDVREDYVERLQNKVIFTNEPYVQDYLSQSENIEFTTNNQKLINESDIIFTLVQTPSLEDGSYDVSAVGRSFKIFKTQIRKESLLLLVALLIPVIVMSSKRCWTWMCIIIQSLLHKVLL